MREADDPTFIDSNLPRLSPQEDEDDDFEWNESPGPSNQPDRVEDHRLDRIDCMDYVWSMAFGSGISRSQYNHRRRFSFNSDLILATGLQSGKIKVWNVYTGRL